MHSQKITKQLKLQTMIKREQLTLLLLCFISFSINAQQWANVGTAGFSAGATSNPVLAVDGATPYMAYIDSAVSNKATVMKYDGTSWILVGNQGFSPVGMKNLDIAIHPVTGEPHVAMQSIGITSITVMKYNGTAWVMLDTVISNAANPSIAFHRTNSQIYLAYDYDEFIPPISFSIVGKLTRFNGSTWIDEGTYGDHGSQVPLETKPSLAFDAFSSYPHVAYGGSWEEVSVRYHPTSSNWFYKGSAGFAGNTKYVSLTLGDTVGVFVHVAFQDGNTSNKTTAMQYQGNTLGWVTLGTAGFSAGSASYQDIVVDNARIPYVAYKDGGNSDKATVMKYDGTAWAPLGTAGFSAGTANYTTLVLSSNSLYIGFQDGANGNKTTVMKYDLATGLQEIEALNKLITIYPNPVSNVLTVQTEEQVNGITILTIDGKVVKSSDAVTISVEELPQGVYFLQIDTEKGQAYKRFVKE